MPRPKRHTPASRPFLPESKGVHPESTDVLSEHADANPFSDQKATHPSLQRAGHARVIEVREWINRLEDSDLDAVLPNDSELIDLTRVLEELKSAAAAAQARAAAAFDASQRLAQARAGLPAAQLGRGVGAQIALARRDSPHRGGRHLGLGKALVHEMPHTLHALSTGVLSEWRATLLVRETACLAVEDRRRIDALICGNPAALEGIGDRQLIARIRSLTQAIDTASQVRRHAKAVADRYVSCRPAPDTMSYLTGLLPVAQGVAVFTALSRTADSLRSSGDERGRGQIMADTLVERITGQAAASQVPVEVQLVMTDRTLFNQRCFTNSFGSEIAVPGGTSDPVSEYQIFRAPEHASALPPDPAPASDPEAATVPESVASTASASVLATRDEKLPTPPQDEPAYFPGYGTVPGQWARDLITDALHGLDPDPAAERIPPEEGIPHPRHSPPQHHVGSEQPSSAGQSGQSGQPSSPGQASQPGRPGTPITGNNPDLQPPDVPLREQIRGHAREHAREQVHVTLRRLYLDPAPGELIAMDSKARYFPPGLARLIRTRDRTCRTPWCDAPIRHIDHIRPHSAGGPTNYTNGQGLCEACNHTKEAPGWTAETAAFQGQRHAVRTVTPTGHPYLSAAPPLLGTPPDKVSASAENRAASPSPGLPGS